MTEVKFIRRKEAGEYLRKTYGFCSARALGKLAVVGGGPEFRKAGNQIVLYEIAKLDQWALAKIGGPQTSTSDVETA